jgi:circadian clock protein KaiB
MKRSAQYKFSVYIARQSRQADLALARLKKICDDKIPAAYEIEVIDLSKRPALATHHNIVATPAIFRTLPAPIRKSIGDLSETDQALLGLDLSPTGVSYVEPTAGWGLWYKKRRA